MGLFTSSATPSQHWLKAWEGPHGLSLLQEGAHLSMPGPFLSPGVPPKGAVAAALTPPHPAFGHHICQGTGF